MGVQPRRRLLQQAADPIDMLAPLVDAVAGAAEVLLGTPTVADLGPGHVR